MTRRRAAPSTGRCSAGPFTTGKGVDPNYTIVKQAGYPIGGIVTIANTDIVPQWLSYVVVPNVDAASAAFTESGGRVYRAPLDVRKDLRVAVVGDAQGAPLGLATRGAETRGRRAGPFDQPLALDGIRGARRARRPRRSTAASSATPAK